MPRARLKRGFCALREQENVPNNDQSDKRAAEIMQMSSNRAMRFVYLRTLPLAKHPELSADVEGLAREIEQAAQRLCAKHSNRVSDRRAAVHLHMGALAIATHRVLSSRIRNETVVTNLIRAGFGAELLPTTGDTSKSNVADAKPASRLPDYWIVRFALWFSFDRMSAIKSMVRNMVKDFGPTFHTEATDESDGNVHRLIVSKLFKSTNLSGFFQISVSSAMGLSKHIGRHDTSHGMCVPKVSRTSD